MPGDGLEQPMAILISDRHHRVLIEGTEVLKNMSSTAGASNVIWTDVLNRSKISKVSKTTEIQFWVLRKCYPQEKLPPKYVTSSLFCIINDWQTASIAVFWWTHTNMQDGRNDFYPVSTTLCNSSSVVCCLLNVAISVLYLIYKYFFCQRC